MDKRHIHPKNNRASRPTQRAPFTFLSLFSGCVHKYPDNIAITFGDSTVIYQELDRQSDNIAKLLTENGIGSDSIVGLMVRRSIEMIAGILGIFKAGGVLLPIDPDFPAERIKFMLEDSGCRTLLTHRMIEAEIPHRDSALFIEERQNYASSGQLPERQEQPGLAYIMYTSGSSGQPKGVMIEHKSLSNFIRGITDIIDFNVTKTILALTTVSFDIFVLEILIPLTKGMQIVLADEREQKNPLLLQRVIAERGVDMLQITPSRMQLLASYDRELHCLQNVKEIMIGGETLPLTLLDKLKRATSARIYNMYGPTETTVWSTVSDLTLKDTVDIGKPIKNTYIYIIDAQNNLKLNGEEGELCISGDGLARGYFNRPELTKRRFVENPFSPGQRMYRTGDLAKWLPDGSIGFIGRLDEQIKIRGYRVEPGEVASCLLKHECINQAVVITKEGKQGNPVLCGYYVADKELDVPDLREHMKKFLPQYMIPDMFVQVEKLPETPNQKIDKAALPDLQLQ